MIKNYIIAVFITVIYLVGLVFLFVEFPKTMITGYALFGAIMWYLMKTAPYDNELWPDLCKE